jgi:hypothetical protein
MLYALTFAATEPLNSIAENCFFSHWSLREFIDSASVNTEITQQQKKAEFSTPRTLLHSAEVNTFHDAKRKL